MPMPRREKPPTVKTPEIVRDFAHVVKRTLKAIDRIESQHNRRMHAEFAASKAKKVDPEKVYPKDKG